MDSSYVNPCSSLNSNASKSHKTIVLFSFLASLIPGIVSTIALDCCYILFKTPAAHDDLQYRMYCAKISRRRCLTASMMSLPHQDPPSSVLTSESSCLSMNSRTSCQDTKRLECLFAPNWIRGLFPSGTLPSSPALRMSMVTPLG